MHHHVQEQQQLKGHWDSPTATSSCHTAWHHEAAQGARTASVTATTTPLSSNVHGLNYVAKYPEIPASVKNSLYHHNSEETKPHIPALAHAAIKHSSGYCKLFQKWRKSSRAPWLLKQLTSSNTTNCPFTKTKPTELKNTQTSGKTTLFLQGYS